MSLIVLVVGVAGVTVLSRLAPMLLLPEPEDFIAEVVARLPAPLFAALAALSLVPTTGSLPDPAIVAAIIGALLVGRKRSLLLTLTAGLTGYLSVAALVS